MSVKTKHESLRKDGALHPNPQRIKDARFSSDSFFDPNDLVQVKYEMLRAVSKDKLSVSKASVKYGLSRPSYYQAKEQFDSEGLIGLIPQKRGPKSARKLTDKILDLVEEQIKHSETKPSWKVLAELVKGKFGMTVHPRSIERIIKKRNQQPLQKKTNRR